MLDKNFFGLKLEILLKKLSPPTALIYILFYEHISFLQNIKISLV